MNIEEKKIEKQEYGKKVDINKSKESSSLRNYLNEVLSPLLIRALAEVAQERPEDPIEFVANYLLKNNPERKLNK